MLGPERLHLNGHPAAKSCPVTPEQALQAARHFVAQVGGLANAEQALTLLALLSPHADQPADREA